MMMGGDTEKAYYEVGRGVEGRRRWKRWRGCDASRELREVSFPPRVNNDPGGKTAVQVSVHF